MEIVNTLLYSIKQGLINIFRNKMFSIASLATMAACIFMFGVFDILFTNFDSMVKEAEEGVAVTVFFNEDLDEDSIQKIGDEISERPEVSDMEYVSAEDAWAYFQDVYLEGDSSLAAGFANDNPLANSANYEIYLKDVSMQDSLVEYLKGLDGVRSVKESAALANTLADFNKLLSYISGGVIIILLLVAIFLISNTVSVGISVRREEIGIMKLIGASDFLVRAPFIVEGIVIGLIGAAIPLMILYSVYYRICLYILDKFNFIGSMISFVDSATIFKTLTPVALALGVGIGLAGSIFTVRKHLNV